MFKTITFFPSFKKMFYQIKTKFKAGGRNDMTYQRTKALLDLAKEQGFNIVTFKDFVKFYKMTL